MTYFSLLLFFGVIWIILTTSPCLLTPKTNAISPIIAHSGDSFTVLSFVKEREKRKEKKKLGSFSSLWTRIWVKMFLQDANAAALGHTLPITENWSTLQKSKELSGALRLFCVPLNCGRSSPHSQELVSTDSHPDQSWAEAYSFFLEGSGHSGLDGNSRWGLVWDGEARQKWDKFKAGSI